MGGFRAVRVVSEQVGLFQKSKHYSFLSVFFLVGGGGVYFVFLWGDATCFVSLKGCSMIFFVGGLLLDLFFVGGYCLICFF